MRTTAYFPKSSGAGIEAGVISTLPAVRGLVPAATRPLSASEANLLAKCETEIHDRLDGIAKHWREIAKRLRLIRDDKLFRAEFRTFEEYVRVRWQKSAHRARQLMAADEVIRDLEEAKDDLPAGTTLPAPPRDLDPSPALGERAASGETEAAKPRVLPTTEGQVRALVPLAKEHRAAAWDKAREIAGPDKQPTAKQVAAAVKESKSGPKLSAAARCLAEVTRKRVLEASQRAVVAIVALQDLVRDNARQNGLCHAAVGYMERLELDVKTERPPTIEQELVWSIRDAAADLGGLEDMLGQAGKADLVPHAGRALAALKPLHDRFKIANMKVNRYAAEVGATANERKRSGTAR